MCPTSLERETLHPLFSTKTLHPLFPWGLFSLLLPITVPAPWSSPALLWAFSGSAPRVLVRLALVTSPRPEAVVKT